MAQITQEIKAFIFDMDGVITDTVHYHYLSWKRLAEEENIPFTLEDNEKLLGLSRPDSLKIFLKGKPVDPTQQEQLLARKNQYFLELISGLSKEDLLPGIGDLLDTLGQRGFKIALASSSKNAKIVIEKLGITSYFDSLSDGSSVHNTKPAPDLFLDAAFKLGVKPEECIVLEDSAAGVQAALSANMKVIGIGPSGRVGQAHWRFDSTANIDPAVFLPLA